LHDQPGTEVVKSGIDLSIGSPDNSMAGSMDNSEGAATRTVTVTCQTYGSWAGRASRGLATGWLPGEWAANETGVVDIPPADPPATAAGLWAGLDGPWQEAFGQAWEALRTGNIAVGACASTEDGQIVYAARNRVTDGAGPPGEIFGSSLAHAEMNVLARLPFGHRRDLVLTTTLQPCLQCAGAIRLGPISTVRFAGADVYWDGCHDFGKLSAREAQRAQPTRIGPCLDELGTFATLMFRFSVILIRRFSPTLGPGFEQAPRALGEDPLTDVVYEMRDGGELERLAAMEVNEALGYLWPRLQELTEVLPAP
jgi:tRNA(adenine34) deaminase